MPAIQVRNCPPDLCATIRETARAHHRSISQEVLAILEERFAERAPGAQDTMLASEAPSEVQMVAAKQSAAEPSDLPAMQAPTTPASQPTMQILTDSASLPASFYSEARINQARRRELIAHCRTEMPAFDLPAGIASVRELIEDGREEWSGPCSF